jgi:hypothetical protein
MDTAQTQEQIQNQNTENLEANNNVVVTPTPPKSRKILKTMLFMVGALIAILVAVGILYTYTDFIDLNGLTNSQVTDPVITSPQDEITKLEEYVNTELEFSISYPQQADFTTSTSQNGDIETFQIAVAGPAQIDKIFNETNLMEGYIVKIIVHKNITNLDLELFSREKRNSFVVKCPATAKVSEITNTKVNFADARRFEVDECLVNYIETFVIRDNLVFEIMQVYKGDVGYKQIYKGQTEEIVQTFILTNTLAPSPVDTWTTYTDTGRISQFSFKYPQEFDTLCCTIAGPHSSTATKLIVIADPHTIVQGTDKRFNGLGIYTDRITDFDSYVAAQKLQFIESYKIVTGRNPQAIQSEIEIGGVKGVLLKDTAWWADIYFVPLPNLSSVLVIAKTTAVERGREQIIDEIISTFQLTSAE